MIKVYYDGAGWNGRIAEMLTIAKFNSQIIHKEHNVYYTNFTNNEMEYLALQQALRYINCIPEDSQLGNNELVLLYTDSELVYKQILGAYKVKALNLKGYYNDAKFLYNQVASKIEEFNWVPRNKNLAGILLEKIQKERKANE